MLYLSLIHIFISDGMELLKEQDFSTRLRLVSDSEANKLIEIFNKMMDQLKDERLQVREKNHFLDLLIQASPQGVIILDFDDKITEVNPSGLRLLSINNINDVKNKKLDESGINIGDQLSKLKQGEDVVTVSYTHLDVYKRQITYTVSGIVEDLSPITVATYAHAWIPLTSIHKTQSADMEGITGMYKCQIIAHSSKRCV